MNTHVHRAVHEMSTTIGTIAWQAKSCILFIVFEMIAFFPCFDIHFFVFYAWHNNTEKEKKRKEKNGWTRGKEGDGEWNSFAYEEDIRPWAEAGNTNAYIHVFKMK